MKLTEAKLKKLINEVVEERAIEDFVSRTKEEFQLDDLSLYLRKPEPHHPMTSLYLSNIRVNQPGQGDGSKALKSIIQFAKDNSLAITLIPTPEDGSSVERLRSWYESHGFEDWYRDGPYGEEDEERQHTKYMVKQA